MEYLGFGQYREDRRGDIKYYYIKYHLGSIRAIVDDNSTVVFAEDYDAWGYGLEGRKIVKGNSMYKFTGKERDAESEYEIISRRGIMMRG